MRLWAQKASRLAAAVRTVSCIGRPGKRGGKYRVYTYNLGRIYVAVLDRKRSIKTSTNEERNEESIMTPSDRTNASLNSLAKTRMGR